MKPLIILSLRLLHLSNWKKISYLVLRWHGKKKLKMKKRCHINNIKDTMRTSYKIWFSFLVKVEIYHFCCNIARAWNNWEILCVFLGLVLWISSCDLFWNRMFSFSFTKLLQIILPWEREISFSLSNRQKSKHTKFICCANKVKWKLATRWWSERNIFFAKFWKV